MIDYYEDEERCCHNGHDNADEHRHHQGEHHHHDHDEHEHHHHHDHDEHHHHDHHNHDEHECCHERHHHDHDEHEHHHHHDGHHHHHHHVNIKRKILQIAITVVLLVAAVIIEHKFTLPMWQLLLIYLVPYLIIGFKTLCEAIEGLSNGNAFNEHFLMSVATIGALCLGFMPNGDPEFAEAVFVMLFFEIGELFEGYAEGRSRESIAHLMDIRPDSANVERNGKVLTLKPESVSVGEVIVVRPGEKVPLDGTIIEGSTSLNTVALTGESAPRTAIAGDDVVSGCINLSGVIRIRTTKSFGESTVSKIINLVESAGEHKSHNEAFISRFARVYTPIVVFLALAIAVLPPLFSGMSAAAFTNWLHRALIFLIVSCPCALVISVPLTFFGGIGGASRNGILIKGANYIDALSKVDTVVMDKTGTLTHGVFDVDVVHPEDVDQQLLLHLAAHVEHNSTHPIAAAIRKAYPDEATDGCNVGNVEEIAGFGIQAVVNGHDIAVGNIKMMEKVGAVVRPCEHTGTVIHVAIDGKYAGHIVISDRIKEDAKPAIERLHQLGVSRTVMLTGDRAEVGRSVAAELGISAFKAELLPTDKVECVEQMLATKPAATTLAFVGDGINDAPVLARADVGIAMGGLGSDAAIEAADVVLMDDKPSKIALAIQIARRTIRIAQQNIVFAIAVKVLVLILAATGIAEMWMAVFADVGVTVLAVFNAMRALSVRQ